MKNVMGLIKLTESVEQLNQLALDRNVAALPFAGRYRVIDFTLSNMVNTGIKNIGIVTQNKYRALMEHLRSGKEWDLHRKRDGLFILPPDYASHHQGFYKGDLENLQAHLNYLHRSRQQTVILSGGRMVYSLNYQQALSFHRENQADITILFQETDLNLEGLPNWTIMEMDQAGRVTDLEVDTPRPKSNKVSMEVYIMSKSLLIDIINTCIARGQYDLVKDGLIKNIEQLKIYGYPFTSYLARITSVNNYYRHSLELLKPQIWQELFYQWGLVYTKAKDEAPTKYLGEAGVKNSLVAGGCVIDGQVENCILFRGVKVARGAQVKDSVLLPKVTVGEGAMVERAILDKEVTITKRKFIRGDVRFPMVVGKQIII